jgi:hypothetical protein
MDTDERRACSICGDSEPFHVHDQGQRIENYFTVGRGMSEMDAARAWQARAVAAEQRVAVLERELDIANSVAATTKTHLYHRIEALKTRAAAAEAERDALRDALKFYADGSSYVLAAVDETGDEWSSPVHEDEGETARAALAASVSKEEARDGT